ncbi:WYL domain-containing protein, partial [Streptomyces roseoviridis]
MKHTNRQTTTRTLADLYRAIDHQHAVTITYLKPGDTEPTVRTIEILEIRTTSAGGIVVIAMCRLREAERQFHLSGIQTYTAHR